MTDLEEKNKKIIDRHHNGIKKKIHLIKEAKEGSYPILDKVKSMIADLDKSEQNYQKEEKAINVIKSHITDIPNFPWERYTEIVDNQEKDIKTLENLIDNLVIAKPLIHPFASVSGQVTATSGFVTETIVDILCESTSDNTNLQQQLKDINVTDTFWENVEYVKDELKKINPDYAKCLEEAIKDFKSVKGEEKSKRLLDLRSCIFHKMFGNIANKQYYKTTNWYTTSSNKRWRFCQSKFFMIGYKEEYNIPTSALNSINNIATSLQKCFDNMSEYGKKGEKNISILNSVFKEALSSLKSACKHRNTHYQPAP